MFLVDRIWTFMSAIFKVSLKREFLVGNYPILKRIIWPYGAASSMIPDIHVLFQPIFFSISFFYIWLLDLYKTPIYMFRNNVQCLLTFCAEMLNVTIFYDFYIPKSPIMYRGILVVFLICRTFPMLNLNSFVLN
jgi:hypothetical protein